MVSASLLSVTFVFWYGEEHMGLSMGSDISVGESSCRQCTRTGPWGTDKWAAVRSKVPGTASPETEEWQNERAQVGITPCWQSSLKCRGIEEHRMILARIQHALEVVCMCEGWITKALAGGEIKRGLSVMLQNPKFHGGKNMQESN